MDADLDSAKITVYREGAIPDTDISPDGRWAVLHLTRNAEPIITGRSITSEEDASAVNISGSVDVRLGPRENISNWSFHFIQLVKLNIAQAVYAGRTSEDGSMAVNYATPPVFNPKFAYEFSLDSESNLFGTNVMPFTNLRAPSIFPKVNNRGERVPGLPTVVTDMDDHPSRKMKVAFLNKATGRDNFLYRATHDLSFLTAFVYRDERTKRITPLAHITWNVVWNALYTWQRIPNQNPQCSGRVQPYTFDFSAQINGPPQDGRLLAKITNPTTDPTEIANALDKTAIANLDRNPDIFNLCYARKWPPDVPSNFFR